MCTLSRVARKWWLSWRSCCALVACFAAWVPVAEAEPESLAILSLASEDHDALATAFTDALRTEAEADPGLRPSHSRASLSQMTIAQDCEISESSCRVRIAAALSVQKVLYGELRAADGGDYQIDLHLFAANGAAQGSVSRLVPREETSTADLSRHARALLRELQGARPQRSDAQEPLPTTVSPDVEPLRPVAVDTTEPAPHKTAAGSNDWIGYTLFGVSGVSLGLMVFSWTQIASAGNDENLSAYRKAVGTAKPSISDVCSEANKGMRYGSLSSGVVSAASDACDRGNTFERLQFVFLGAALISAGVGTYFLLDDEQHDRASAGRTKLALRPAVSRHSAQLSLHLQF
jgi:hypothetical protein